MHILGIRAVGSRMMENGGRDRIRTDLAAKQGAVSQPEISSGYDSTEYSIQVDSYHSAGICFLFKCLYHTAIFLYKIP